MNDRDRLIARIGSLNDPDIPRPLVSLELFFAGNADRNSIGESRSRKHSPQVYFDLFRKLRSREDVADVLVEVTGIGTPDGWPTTDTIWVITSLPLFPELQRALPDGFIDILPDDRLTFPRLDKRPTENIDIPVGMTAWGFYYY
ncbi:MAG TPA: hypothetical protein DDW52_06325 [Planctomycetaceae bacterium]|nr:hypothetical protein [Planctomycetaceae bacterium]